MFEKEAEEYADNTRIKDKNTYISFPDESISEVQDFEGNYIDISERIIKTFKDASEFGYNKANEWHNLNENSKDLPGEDEWVEGLYIWYYKDKPQWDIFKVRWFYEIGELDEKLVCWYSSDDCWHKVDEPDYWRKINLPTRNEHDRKY